MSFGSFVCPDWEYLECELIYAADKLCEHLFTTIFKGRREGPFKYMAPSLLRLVPKKQMLLQQESGDYSMGGFQFHLSPEAYNCRSEQEFEFAPRMFQVAAEFLQANSNTESNNCGHNILLLGCLMQIGDDEGKRFADCLQQLKFKLPGRVLLNFLKEAIEHCLPEAVSALLKQGLASVLTVPIRKIYSSPQQANSSDNLLSAIGHFCRMCLILDPKETLSRQMKILSQFFVSGNLPLLIQEDSLQECFASIFRLSCFKPAIGPALEQLLDSVSSIALQKSRVISQTFASVAFQHILFYWQTGGAISSVIPLVILPFLRSGVRIQSDNIVASSVARNLDRQFDFEGVMTMPNYENHGRLIFGAQPLSLMDLFIECCQKSRQVAAKLRAESDADFLTNRTFILQAMTNRIKFKAETFGLQLAARNAILSCLPFGVKRRQDAIASLQLPRCLEYFLNFREFAIAPQHQLLNAAWFDDVEALRQLQNYSVVRINQKHALEIETWPFSDPTALIIASARGNIDAVRFLVTEMKADIEAKTNIGATALMVAAANNELPVVQSLLDSGANVDARDKQGATALVYAARSQKPRVVKLLIEHNADINAKRQDNGQNVLQAAIENKDYHAVKLLLSQAKLDVEAKDLNGDTALLLACKRLDCRIIEALLESKRVDLEAIDSDGNTALLGSCYRNYLDVVKRLLYFKANIEAKNRDGQTALIIAVDRVHFDVVKALLCYEADVKARDNQGNTPLLLACSRGHFETVNELLRFRAEVEETNNDGETPLMRAAQAGKPEIVAMLLEWGAKVDSMSNSGATPLSFATNSANSADGEREKIIEMLQNALDLIFL